MKVSELLNHVASFHIKLSEHAKLHRNSYDEILGEYNRDIQKLTEQSRELLLLLGGIRKYIYQYDPNWLMESSGTKWDALLASVGMSSLVTKNMSLQAVEDKILVFVGHLKSLNPDGQFEDVESVSEIDNLSEFLKETMINVATGQSNIKDVNEGYKKAYKEYDAATKSKGMKNPNPYSDLWEFYNFWKNNLPGYASRRDYVIKLFKNEADTQTPILDFVHESRIEDLSKVTGKFDFSKLCRLLSELNSSYRSKNIYACGMILRAIIDHVPPVFSYGTFHEVANSYAGGGKSFKEAMLSLSGSMRKISDGFLHTHIRSKESLPEEQQIRFHAELDLLLAEIIRITKA